MKKSAVVTLSIALAVSHVAAAKWHVSRSVDEITDHTTCTVSTFDVEEPDLLAIVMNGKLSFSVAGGRSYPGRLSAIRVDQNPAFTFEDRVDGEKAMELLAQLEAGSRVRTRFVHWPDGAAIDSEGPIGEFAADVRSCLTPAPKGRKYI